MLQYCFFSVLTTLLLTMINIRQVAAQVQSKTVGKPIQVCRNGRLRLESDASWECPRHHLDVVARSFAGALHPPGISKMGYPITIVQSTQTTSIINESVVPWRDLKPSDQFVDADGLKFFRLKTDNGSAAYLIVVNLRNRKYIIKPFFNSTLGTTSDAARLHNALVAINGGYFNLSNGESTSYIVIDGHEQCNPRKNKDLVENPRLKPYLERIFNRSQVMFIRYLTGEIAGETFVLFSSHDSRVGRGLIPPCGLRPPYEKSLLQAGPLLLPKLTDKEEAFVRTDSTGKIVDAIGSHKSAARTAFGITTDGYAMLLCVASKGQDEFSSGVTLAQLASILKTLGCTDAINFDGGTSTTMVIRQVSGTKKDNSAPDYNFQQVCGRTPEKLVKSGLMILPVINSRTVK